MHTQIEIQVTEEAGLPLVRLPREQGWSLADYLAQQGVRLTYQFRAKELLMYFHYLDRATIDQLLDQWARANDQGYVPSAPLQPDRWLVGHHA